MKRRFTILTAALALLAFLAIPMGMKGQTTTLVSGSGTSGYSIPDGWTSSGTVEGGSYLKFDNGTITSPEFAPHNGLSFTYSVATFGSGTNHPLTIRILNASTNAVISEMTTATPTSSTYINTGSPLSLGDVTVAFKIQMYGPTGKGVRLRNYSVTGTPAGGQQLTPSDLALVDAPVELEFDLYDNANAQTISYTTSSTGAVTVSQNNYITATVNVNNTITVTPVAVTNGPQTITVTQAADATYATGSVTFTVDIEDSTPFTGGDVTFLAGTDLGSTTENNSPDEMEKNGVTVYSTDAAFATAQYRLYKSSVTTISVESGTITNIVFNGQSTSYPVSNLSVNGNNGSYTVSNNVGTWTGNSNEISFSASSGQVRLSSIVVTVETSGTPDPTISANNVDIAYNATSGSITYTINNEPSPAGTLTAAVTDGNWLTLGQGTTSPISFTCTANENTTARTATVTLTYTYNTDQTVSANVTVTQAAAPVSYTTIPALFNAATQTETSVYVTFNNWVVSGVSTNGKNVFVTDNNGNGFVIYYNSDMSSTYATGDILSGTAVSCTLKKYNGFAELINVDATDLTITSGGTVSTANVALADLTGVNTGALLHYDNLICSVDDSGNTTKYYLSNGSTTIQVYNSLFAFEALEDGETYNITGIYQQYNNTKEILPRSAADIVKVEVQHNEYTLTVGTLNEHINGIFVFDAADPNTQLIANGQAGTAQVLDGTEVMVSVDVEEGYMIESLIVDGNNVTSQIVADAYTFTMPTHAVTITATAVEYVAPVGGDYVRITSLDQLTDGSKVIIASRYNNNANAYKVLPNHFDGVGGAGSGRLAGDDQTSQTSGTDEVLAVTNPSDYVWTVSIDNDGHYIFTNVSGLYFAYSSGTEFVIGSNQNSKKEWSISEGTAGDNALMSGYTGFVIINVNTSTRGVALQSPLTFGAYSTTANLNGSSYNFYLDFFVQTEESDTYTKTIIGYNSPQGNGEGNYYLIASPIGDVAPTAVTGMTSGSYDLYYFDHAADKEWVNYKPGTGSNHPGFDLASGTGYLYANSQTIDLVFTGTAHSTEDVEIVLSRTETADGYTVDMPGWNLVGNPFAVTAYIADGRDFYTMNSDGTDFEISNNPERNIDAMEGIFVIAQQDGETMTFTTTQPTNNSKSVALNLSNGRNVIDRAMVRFGEGRTLPKFQLNKNHTKVYIPMDGQDYAVVRSEEMGEMPVNFKAENNGTYSLSLSCDNVEFAYLHLIDNLTGKDIDLLQTPSYSFEAKTTDYESRFKLVFATGDNSDNETFAFFSNGSFVINNEDNATLQVIDITGRILKSESINGCANVNVNAAPGVYMLRLVNGDNVKVQKVVVK